MSNPMSVRQITPKHLDTLAKSAISEAAALAWGIFSVVAADELPADLAQYKFARGMVFPLRQADGSVIHQIRLDAPLPDGGKYLQPGDTGSIINIPECMAARVGVVTKVLIVEGTKQTIAACLYAPEDTLVIGIQGCANFSKAGVPKKVWASVVRADDDATICFDADWTTNHNVWSAAKNLKGHLESNCFAKVKLAEISGGGKMGLDDALGSVPETSRTRLVTTLVTKAKTSLGREPKKKNTESASRVVASQIVVDMEAGQTYRIPLASPTPGVPTAPPEILMPAAARIVEVESHVDEGNTGSAPTVQLTLEVAVKVDTRPKPIVHNVTVPSSHLANIGEWLDKLPHGLGVGIPRDSRPNDELANAIRTADAERIHISVLPRLGWYLDKETLIDIPAAAGVDKYTQEGVWRWCDGKGAIGPDGKVGHLRGRPGAKDFQAIDLVDPGVLSDETARQRVRDFILTRDLLMEDKKFNWDVAISGWALSLLGITPNAALAYFGPPSSGKSTIAQAIASTLSPSWAPGSGSAMATFNARPAGMDLLANGMSHCFLHVDDLKPESDQQSMKNALKAFDALLRRSHGSGGAVRGGIDKNSDSLIVRGVDNSSPFVIVTGEEIPTGGDFAESGLDRALIIPVEPRSLFGDDRPSLDEVVRRAAKGEYRDVTSVYLRWIAQQIDARTEVVVERRFDNWKTELDAARASMSEETSKQGIIPDDLRVSDRARLLAASLMLGMQTLLAFALELGSLDETEADAIQERFSKDLISEVKDHTRTVMGGNASVEDRALSILRSAVSSRQVSIDFLDNPNRPLIGERKTLDGQDVVAINVRAAADALRYVGGDRALTKALAKVAMLDNKGLPTRTLAVNKTRVQAVVIPGHTWDAAEDAVDGRPAGLSSDF